MSQRTAEVPGVQARRPREIPKRGWMQIAKRGWSEAKADQVPLIRFPRGSNSPSRQDREAALSSAPHRQHLDKAHHRRRNPCLIMVQGIHTLPVAPAHVERTRQRRH
jgi:hypothetical protein